MTQSSPNNPSATETITAHFERLPLKQKLAAFEDIVCSLSTDVRKLDDPALNNSLDLLDTIESNIRDRIDEVIAIYGGVE
jgi:hypothetical protein